MQEREGISLTSKLSQENYLLFLILGFAFLLRIWGISSGLPYTYINDEGHEVLRALRLGMGSFDFERTSKGGFFYILFIEYGVLFVVLKLIGSINSTRDFVHLYFNDPTLFYLIGRITNAFIGTVSVICVYKLGSVLYSKRIGLIAALLLSVNSLHVEESHQINVDILLTFLCLVCFLYLFKVYKDPSMRNYTWFGFFSGLTAMTKIPGVLVWVPIIVSHILNIRSASNRNVRNILNINIIIAFAVFTAIFIAGNPGFLINLDERIFSIIGRFIPLAEAAMFSSEAPLRAENSPRYVFYLHTLSNSMGRATFVFGLAGIIFTIFKYRRAHEMLMVSFIAIFFVALLASRNPYHVYGRYILPFLPLIILFSAVMIVRFASMIDYFVKPAYAAALLLTLVLSINPLISVIKENIMLTKPDSRTLAKEWITENIPENSRILIAGHTAAVLTSTVPLYNSTDNVRQAIALFKERKELGKAKYFEMELEFVEDKRYNLIFLNLTEIRSWNAYKKENVDYVVISPYKLINTIRSDDELAEKLIDDIRLDPHVTLVQTFNGEQKNILYGPYIEIYRVRYPH